MLSECHLYFKEYLLGKTSAHIISLPRNRLRAVYMLENDFHSRMGFKGSVHHATAMGFVRLILFCETKRNKTKYMGEGEKMLIYLNTA